MTIAGGSSELGLVLEQLPQVIVNHGLSEVEKPKIEKRYGPKLELNMVSKSFSVPGGKIQALKNINLSVNLGEFVCLTGPSGCGKSTLLNIIAGLEKPDTGDIKSYDNNGKSCEGKDYLLIFQEASLFPWLTVFDNVAYGLKLRKIPKIKYYPMVEKYLSLVHLSAFKDACIHQLSGGMKQRVALARALVLDPQMLLLDEPFAA